MITLQTFAPGTPILGILEYAIDGTVRTLTRTPGGLGNGNTEDFSVANFTALGSGPSGFTGGVMGDMLVYDRPLSTAERNQVEAYLQSRYP